MPQGHWHDDHWHDATVLNRAMYGGPPSQVDTLMLGWRVQVKLYHSTEHVVTPSNKFCKCYIYQLEKMLNY